MKAWLKSAKWILQGFELIAWSPIMKVSLWITGEDAQTLKISGSLSPRTTHLDFALQAAPSGLRLRIAVESAGTVSHRQCLATYNNLLCRIRWELCCRIFCASCGGIAAMASLSILVFHSLWLASKVHSRDYQGLSVAVPFWLGQTAEMVQQLRIMPRMKTDMFGNLLSSSMLCGDTGSTRSSASVSSASVSKSESSRGGEGNGRMRECAGRAFFSTECASAIRRAVASGPLSTLKLAILSIFGRLDILIKLIKWLFITQLQHVPIINFGLVHVV